MNDDVNPYQPPHARVDSSEEPGADLQRVLSGKKLVMYALLANVAAVLLQLVLRVPGVPVGLMALALSIYGVVKLTRGLGMWVLSRVLLSLLMFLPPVNLVALLLLHARAARVLRDAGYTPGLLGASR
jgi:hypothetical protein